MRIFAHKGSAPLPMRATATITAMTTSKNLDKIIFYCMVFTIISAILLLLSDTVLRIQDTEVIVGMYSQE